MTVGKYKLRSGVEADLDGYARYIAKDSLIAARRLYDKAQETLQMLADMPLMGTPYRAIRNKSSGIRFAPIKDYPNHLIYYRPQDGFIDVLCILHARMDKGPKVAPYLLDSG